MFFRKRSPMSNSYGALLNRSSNAQLAVIVFLAHIWMCQNAGQSVVSYVRPSMYDDPFISYVYKRMYVRKVKQHAKWLLPDVDLCLTHMIALLSRYNFMCLRNQEQKQARHLFPSYSILSKQPRLKSKQMRDVRSHYFQL